MKGLWHIFTLIIFYQTTVPAFTLSSIFGTLDDPKLPKKCYGNDLSESLRSGINDIVIVRQLDGSLKSTPFQARVGKLTNWKTLFTSREGKKAKLYINNIRVLSEANIIVGDSGSVFIQRIRSGPTCMFTNNEMQRMALNDGMNEALLVVTELNIKMTFSIYLFGQNKKLVITDIDGTITTTDFKGFVGGNIGFDVHHSKVVEFFNKVSNNGYTLIYLTARPLGFDDLTRKYLFDTLQNEDGGYSMPKFPLFLSPISGEKAITADAKIMKAVTLRSILDLFDIKENVVYGAYGNKNHDTEAYLNVGIRGEKIFLINTDSKMINVATGKVISYPQQIQTVNKMYPKL